MYKAIPIAKDLYFVGAQDPDLRVFDVVMSAPNGTSYNSYVVRGESGVAVIEAGKAGFEDQWIGRIRDCVDPAEITHIILNHTEPDHSGSLYKLLEIAPNAKVYSSRAANTNLKEILNAPFPGVVVKGGDTLDLGGKTIHIIDAPFLHWPDSLFNWIPEMNALFTCDVFGFHYSAPDMVFDATAAGMVHDRKYYFDVIFSPFAEYVKAALEKIHDLPIQYILTCHGPVYTTPEQIGEITRLYGEWADEVINSLKPNDVFVGWVSSYGYTKEAAEHIARALRDEGLNPVMMNIGEDPGKASAAAACCAGVAIGSSTLNRDALPPVWVFLSELSAYRMRKRPGLVFGSYGWSGEGVPNVHVRLEQLGLKVQEDVRFKFKPTEQDLQAAYEAGIALAKAVKGGS